MKNIKYIFKNLKISLLEETFKFELLLDRFGFSKYKDLIEEGRPLTLLATVTKSSFISINKYSLLNNLMPENIINYVINFFRPVSVEGYLDDLIGQQLFIHFLLISVVFGLILILSVYIFINIFIHNKDYILKRFNNKFILLYIKYQLVLAKISMFLLPLLLMFGLLELLVGLHFLITHPIPFEKLPIDLHTYIDKK